MGSLISGIPNPNPSVSYWSDDPIVGGATRIRKPHVDELRLYLEEMSGHSHDFGGTGGLGPTPTIGVRWGDQEIIADETKIRDDHWLEMRLSLENLDGHYHVVPGYANDSSTKDIDTDWDLTNALAVDEKPFKEHIDELRTACGELYNHTHTLSWCDCVEYCDNCPCRHQNTCVVHSW